MLIIILLAVTTAYAQHSEQPTAESNTDLRGSLELFSIQNPDGEMIVLERTSNFEYFIAGGEKGPETKTKIDAKAAETLDRSFVSIFIKSMYELATYEGKCEKSWNLKMKGDVQKVCKEDDKRHQLLVEFLDPLRKKYSF